MDFRLASFLYTASLKFLDAATVILAWHLCWLLRFDTALFPTHKGIPEFGPYSAVSIPLAIVFCAVFHLVGAYRKERLHFGFRAIKKIVEGSCVSVLVFVSICYFQGSIFYSRIYLLLFSGLVVLMLSLSRFLLYRTWRRIRQAKVTPLRTLVIGSGPLLELYIQTLETHQPYPVQWIGLLGPQSNLSIPYLGSEKELSHVLDSQNIQQVVVSYPAEASQAYASILQQLSEAPASVKVIPDYGRFSTFTYSANQEFGVPLLEFNQAPIGLTDRFLKRALDVTFSSIASLFLLPVGLWIALRIKLSSPGPIFYSQKRVGADGVSFQCFKFRTMRVGAEKETGPVWANQNDDRTTSFGKWLRRTSLDELPQLFNVLRGEMSMVGPRPERPKFVQQFKTDIPKYMLRHKMKSGVTGWAQVNGLRGNTSLEERIRYDLYYIGHWSLLFDIKILLTTPWTLWKGYFKGEAY